MSTISASTAQFNSVPSLLINENNLIQAHQHADLTRYRNINPSILKHSSNLLDSKRTS